MSELIAEARVLVTPDTTTFRPLLIAQVNAAAKGVVVPVQVTPVVARGTAGLVGAQQELAAATTLSAGAIAQEQALLARGAVILDQVTLKEEANAAAIRGATDARRSFNASAAKQARQLGQLERGAGATALSLGGLRGATLAASAPFIAGAVAATVFAKSLGSFVTFEQQLNVLQATSGATADEMGRVSDAAKQLGADVTLPAVNAQDAAEAMTELSKAGLSVQDSIGGARGVLQLATAANIDNAQATELAASALNAFGLAGTDAVHVADVLANAANDSQGSIIDIGIALRQAAAVGRQAGLSLEQVVGVLTIFARNGLVGSDAGTAFRTMLLRLINPTEKAAKLINDLGLNLRTATGAIDLTVFDQFTRATENMTKRQRDQTQAIIFGQDAIRGAAIATREGNAAIDAQTEALNNAGAAQRLAAARTKGLAGEFENAKNQAAEFGLTLGQISSGPTSVFVTAAGNLFKSLNEAADVLGTVFHPEGADFQETTKNFTQLTEAAAKLQQTLSTGDAQEFTGQLTVGLQAVADQLAKTGRELVRQGFLTNVVDAFIRLSPDVKRAMEDNVITPAEQAQLEATALGRAFIEAIPHTADLFQSFGLNAKSAIEDAGAAIKDSGPTIAEATAEAIHDAASVATPAAKQTGAELGGSIAASIAAAIKGAQGQIADAFASVTRTDRLRAGAQASNLVDIEFQGGTPQQQLAGLRALLDTQKQIVADLVGRGAPRAKIDAAKRDAIATQNEINSVVAEIASGNAATVNKAKKAASEKEAQARKAASAQAKADQAVLDSFAPAQNRIDLTTISANATARLSDNVKLQTLIIAEGEREKQIIKDTVQDRKTKNTALAAQAETIKAAEVERNRLIAQIAATATENRRKAADALTASLGKAITLAGLRENDKAEVTAINKAIANARNRIKNYKRIGLNLQDEKIALEQLINQRDDVLDTAKSATEGLAGGTTLVDLFKENQQIAAQAGNIGRLPSQLTSSAANQPIRDLVQQRLDLRVSDPTRDNLARTQQTTTERLIASLEQLTSALTGNSTTVGGFRVKGGVIDPTGTGIKDLAKEQRFFYQKQAKQMVEHGLVA